MTPCIVMVQYVLHAEITINRLTEDELSGSKNVEDLQKSRIQILI